MDKFISCTSKSIDHTFKIDSHHFCDFGDMAMSLWRSVTPLSLPILVPTTLPFVAHGIQCTYTVMVIARENSKVIETLGSIDRTIVYLDHCFLITS